MKKAFALALAIILGSATVLKAASDRIIQFAQLPQAAQTLVKKHFAGKQVSYVKEDKELTSTTYEVRLSDGTEIDFDSKGNWKDIDGKHQAIPEALLPIVVRKSLAEAHKGERVLQIERKRTGYEVKLSSGLEVRLNKQGVIVGYDD